MGQHDDYDEYDVTVGPRSAMYTFRSKYHVWPKEVICPVGFNRPLDKDKSIAWAHGVVIRVGTEHGRIIKVGPKPLA